MIDIVKLLFEAGHGGKGKVSFYRSRGIAKGGPDGGNGGNGGSIILRTAAGMNTLQHLAGLKKISAPNGQLGGKRDRFGMNGEDVIVDVPVGTTVWLVDENQTSRERRWYVEHEGTGRFRQRLERYYLEKATDNPEPQEPDQVDPDLVAARLPGDVRSWQKEKLLVLDKPGMEVVIAHGGKGGRGNALFKSSLKTTPMEAEYGGFGEQKLLLLELKLLADIGLVGLPNAGKSSLLSRLTKATARIADYPFTTLEPQLGVMVDPQDRTKSLVMADIPGLIAGASQGKGLGHQFLRHLENCRALMVMTYIPEEELVAAESDPVHATTILKEQMSQLEEELLSYSQELADKPRLLVINKCDLYSPSLMSAFSAKWPEAITISTVTGLGLDKLVRQAITNWG
jgi:GTPase